MSAPMWRTAEKVFRGFAWAAIIAFLVLFFLPFVGFELFDAVKRDPKSALDFALLPGFWLGVLLLAGVILGLMLVNQHWKAAGRGSVWRQSIPGWVYLCAGLMISGSCMTAAGTSDFVFGGASEKWPTTKGSIELSQLGSGTRRQRLGPGKRYYYPEIRYRYRVGEREYLSERISADEVFILGARDITDMKADPSDAQRILTRYPEGATVRVFYDPDDPRDALLEPGPTSNAQRKALFGSLLFASGCVLLLAKWRRTAPL
jgi:Protein of unknown function (DUF3592)